MNNFQEINLLDLPKSEFFISIKKEIISLILKNITMKKIDFYIKLSHLDSQKYKKNKLKEIVNSYSKTRMPHYEATFNYLIVLKELQPINLKSMGEITKRNYGTLLGVFDRLSKQGYVNKTGRKILGTKSTPWIYELSKKGQDYINYGYTKK